MEILHPSFVALVCIVRQSKDSSCFQQFEKLDSMQALIGTHTLDGWCEKIAEGKGLKVKKKKLDELLDQLASIGFVLDTNCLADPVAGYFSQGGACYRLPSNLDALVDFSAKSRLRLKQIQEPKFLLEPLRGHELRGERVQRLGIRGLNSIESLINRRINSISLFELVLLGSMIPIDWRIVSSAGVEPNVLTTMAAHFEAQLQEQVFCENKLAIDKMCQLNGARATGRPFAANNESFEIDLTGEWLIQATEFSFEMSKLDELLQALNQQLQSQHSINRNQIATIINHSSITSFNRLRSNLPKVSRVFRKIVNFVHTETATGASANMAIYDAQIKGRNVFATYSFTVTREGQRLDTSGLAESKGEFELYAVNRDQLQGYYVGVETHDMALPDLPRRNFPMVFGAIQADRVKEQKSVPQH
jgi:hypothetical protein